MRNLFLVLVLANLAFAAWHRWFSGPADSEFVPAASHVPSITLMSELPSEAEEAAARAPPSAEAPVLETYAAMDDLAAERCISIGPFRELSQAATAAANLRTAGYDPSQRVGEGDIWVGYWVHLAGIATKERADEILANLRENGVSDSYIIPGGEAEQIISLGVFSEISRAGRRREHVRGLGYEPTVVDRNRRGTVYWVDVTLAADQTLDLEPLQTPGRIIRLEQRGCEAQRS
jgi:hypothetical protein